MKLTTIAVSTAALLFATTAGAATLDFEDLANGAETGISNGDSLMIDGLNVTFTATGTNGPGQEVAAYLDHDDAGLGVCSNWTATAAVNDNECNPSSDDNVTSGESVTLTFDNLIESFTISSFNDSQHNSLAGSTDTLLINGIEYSFTDALGATFSGTDSITFAFDDVSGNGSQFYVGVAEVALVPLPAAGLLLLAGMGGLAAMRRRRKAA